MIQNHLYSDRNNFAFLDTTTNCYFFKINGVVLYPSEFKLTKSTEKRFNCIIIYQE